MGSGGVVGEVGLYLCGQEGTDVVPQSPDLGLDGQAERVVGADVGARIIGEDGDAVAPGALRPGEFELPEGGGIGVGSRDRRGARRPEGLEVGDTAAQLFGLDLHAQQVQFGRRKLLAEPLVLDGHRGQLGRLVVGQGVGSLDLVVEVDDLVPCRLEFCGERCHRGLGCGELGQRGGLPATGGLGGGDGLTQLARELLPLHPGVIRRAAECDEQSANDEAKDDGYGGDHHPTIEGA